jgi:predicted trehalose synthase
MKNPWIKKNPFLSMWLSGANAMLGAARGRAAAEGKRQTTAMMNQAAKNMADMWTAPRRKSRKKH